MITVVSMATACSGSSHGAQDESTVVVGTWGGDYQKYLEQFVDPALAEQGGSPDAVYATGNDTARLAKLRAEKNSADGSMDVVALSIIEMQQAADAGLLEKLDTSKVPNLANVDEKLKNPYWVPHIYSPNVIIYNTDEVATAPTSYEDLWDEKYAGKIGIQAPQSQDFFHAAATLAQGKNATSDFMSGLPLLKELAPNTQVFASQEQLGAALMSGQVWMTLNWKARAYQWIEASDAPLAVSVPKEGTYATQFEMAIPKNAPNKEAAYAYLNALLDPDAQLGFATSMGYLPSVLNSGMSDKLREQLGVPREDEVLVEALDIADIADNYGDVVSAWNQEIINR
ncbi:PotD/PotF family extracellular solute-binding protein [Microbacterium sp. MPKO10]|uniref:ABC transporter substrate-binding protein n=1 Tax=Microbacterium sp. MPKO10 TaxID=2989818 RepID=UPI002235BFF8|nr:ABC transporter substrate-binding protein [Microbacterium sp. MPKO10]MCW4456839.1 ABC transporter substrate-binding protein [Microbacterium sp. MPKO10]